MAVSTATDSNITMEAATQPTLPDLLKGLLSAHRQVADPREFGWREPRGRTAGRKPGTRVVHEQIARKMGRSRMWYIYRETGVVPFTVAELEQVADLLHMTWRARVALYRRALRCEPLPSGPGAPSSAGDAAWARSLASQPTCLVDDAFNLRDYNAEFASFIRVAKRRLARSNLMSLLLLEDLAGNQWREREMWQEALAAELIEAAALRWHAQPELQRLHVTALEHPQTGALYKEARNYLFPERSWKLLIRSPQAGLLEITFAHPPELQA